VSRVQEVSCQFSVYPLGVADLGGGIDAALAAVRRHGLQVEAGAMSNTMTGPSDDVFAALHDAFEAAAGGGCVLVATVSNACPT
jgi:uncharacterized protein YqgV (UPF0045/DUF77 family)